MLKRANKPHEVNKREGRMQDLFISLGCLAVENYAQIILKYNEELNSELKRVLTLIVNNLQICSQLKSRISNLEQEIVLIKEELSSTNQKRSLIERKNRLEKSLTKKEKKLIQLNKESINFLFKIGKEFNKYRLLQDNKEFQELYNKIDFLTTKTELNLDSKEAVNEDLDITGFNLNDLFSV